MKKFILKISLLIIIIFPFAINAQSIGSVSVKTWADDKKAAFSLTFDDGYESQYTNALPILNNYGIKATFYVITGSLAKQGETKQWLYGTWDEFAQMAAQGHEVAAHTVTHPDLTKISVGKIDKVGTAAYEIYQSKIDIEQNIPGEKVISFAYPFTTNNSNVSNLTNKYYVDSRVGGDLPNSADPSDWTNLKSYEVQFNKPRNSTSDDLDELNQAKIWIQNAIANGQWSMLFTHEVLPFSQIPDAVKSGSWYPMSTEWLDAFCSWLKTKSDNDILWVETAGNVTRYIKERENFSSTVLASSDTELKLQVTDGLDNSIFNYPLTVDVVVPTAWDSVEFSQGNIIGKFGTFMVGNKKYVRLNVVPDGGDVILQNSSTVPVYYSFSGNVNYDNSSNTPLSDVTLKLKDQNGITISTMTDLYGNFNFPDLLPGDYSLTISKTGGWGGVNASDALLALKYFSNTISLTDLQKLAGDVDNNGTINAADALLMVRRYVNLISSFSINDWLFDKQNTTVTISDQNVEENIKALVAGNISRSYMVQ